MRMQIVCIAYQYNCPFCGERYEDEDYGSEEYIEFQCLKCNGRMGFEPPYKVFLTLQGMKNIIN